MEEHTCDLKLPHNNRQCGRKGQTAGQKGAVPSCPTDAAGDPRLICFTNMPFKCASAPPQISMPSWLLVLIKLTTENIACILVGAHHAVPRSSRKTSRRTSSLPPSEKTTSVVRSSRVFVSRHDAGTPATRAERTHTHTCERDQKDHLRSWCTLRCYC